MKPTLEDFLNAADRGERVVVIHHHPCPDGFASAWAAWSALGSKASYVPYDHERPPEPEACAGAWVAMCDCCFRRAGMVKAASLAKAILVLDHHKSAAIDCAGLDYCHFDLDKSGCGLAWDFFRPGQARPALIDFVEDRDLERYRLAGTGAFCSKLDSLPMDFQSWDGAAKLEGAKLDRFMREGSEMLVQFESQAQAIAVGATPCVFMGRRALLLNAPYRFSSRCGAILCERPGAEMALIWSSQDLKSARLSMRSLPNSGCDVSDLAVALGGGGHATASGASVSLARLSELASPLDWSAGAR